jgi:hypothetical protein
MAGPRLKGQEVSIRVVLESNEVRSIDSISSFNDEVALEIKEDGFLGEVANRFDEILNGFGGDFETHLASSGWIFLVNAIIDRAQRRRPAIVFNVVRTDLFADGTSLVYTYKDVKWGSIPQTLGSRGDFVKAKFMFKCTERPVQQDSV